MLNLDDAIYFNGLGYDIFDESSNFYKDYCSPASINGNDIILSDRKKDFYPNNFSLCNDSCIYSQVDLNSKRFTCECDINYNFSEKIEKGENGETEDDTSYIEYFLSLINYKIIKCYKLFLEYKSYYYNAGFYITVGTLFFCIFQLFIFIKWGIKAINIIVLKNIPNEDQLIEMAKEQQKNWNNLKKIKFKGNPPKKGSFLKLEKEKSKSKSRKCIILKNEGEDIEKIKSKSKNKIVKIVQKRKNNTKLSIKNQIPVIESKGTLKFKKNKSSNAYDSSYNNKYNYSNVSNETFQHDEQARENIDKKELNIIPFTKALRVDKRSCFQIFLSVLAHEIKIINIFYYKHPYEHLSIVLSQYIFELCLDLTLNGLLYTEDVISEKYNNNGSIKFFTTLSLSFISNIISSIISFFISKLSEYAEFFEFILKDVFYKSKYYLNILRFKKLLCIKLSSFFIIQTVINFGMCYYLTIFCTVYHNTQGSILINYLTGIAESIAISFGLTIIISIMRSVSIQCQLKSLYYTSKYFFENF